MSSSLLPASSSMAKNEAGQAKEEILGKGNFPPTPSFCLLQEYREMWKQGQRINAKDFLTRYPDQAQKKEVVVDLVYEEYCQRVGRGESPDPVGFALEYPHYQSSLCRLFVAHRGLSGELPLQPGDTFLGFEVVRELGKGAFARVYLAQEKALGQRLVAIKVGRTGPAEGNILGQLSHPHIVPVHSIQQDPYTGLTVVCMPFLGQATLADVIDHAFAGNKPPRKNRVILETLALLDAKELTGENRKPPGRQLRTGAYRDGVLYLGLQLAQALAFVHDHKIFHRDLKPSNVLLTPDGRPMLLDFNLSADGKAPDLLGGTIPYMSPEQLHCTDPHFTGPTPLLDERSDLYSLGVILYQLASGQHPFLPVRPVKQTNEEFRRTLLESQARGPRPLDQANPDVDRHMARVIERCLAFAPETRYASGDELAGEIKKCLAPPGRVRRQLARKPRTFLTGALAAGVLLAAAILYPSLREPTADREYRAGVQAYRQGDFGLVMAHCTRALEANPEAAKTLFLRGMAQQKLGYWEAALSDFLKVEKLGAPEMAGPVKACLGYCYQQALFQTPEVATFYYKEALQRGFANAALYNNLAYGCLKTRGQRGLIWKEKYLDKALELDPNLQPVYHNKAFAELVKTLVEVPNLPRNIPPHALDAMAKALELGPASAELYKDAARIYAVASAKDQQLRPKALEYARQAVERGWDFQDLKNDQLLASLHTDPQFLLLANLPQRTTAVVRAKHLVDPADRFNPE